MQPSTAIERLDLSITYVEFALLANRRRFVGLQLMPPLLVGAKSVSKFPKIAVESLLTKIESTERNPYAGYNRDTYEFTNDSYTLEDHGVEELVDDALLEMYGDMIRAEQAARMRAINRVAQKLEDDIRAAVEAQSNTTAAGTVWSTTTATPLTNIETAAFAVRDRIGLFPNTLAMSDRSYLEMQKTTEVQDRLDLGANDNPNQLTAAGLRNLYPWLENILFFGSSENTAIKGQSASMAQIWDETKAHLMHVHNDGMDGDLTDITPQFGRTLFHREDVGGIPGEMDDENVFIVEEYREENRRGGVIRARNWRQVKTLHTAAGQMITGL